MRSWIWVALLVLAGCVDDADPDTDRSEDGGAVDGDTPPDANGRADAADPHDAGADLDAGRAPDLGAAPDFGMADLGFPDLGADAAPDASEADAGECVLPDPPEPDCSPAGLGFGDGEAIDFVVASLAFEERLDPEVVHMSFDCRLPAFFERQVFADEESFLAFQQCFDAEPEPSGVDWERWRLALYLANEQPEWSVLWAVRQGGTIHVGAELPAYCGGPAPTDSVIAALLPAGPEAIAEQLAACRTGSHLDCCACEVICDPEPRRGECECPP